jgi:hypothetical protein
MDHGGGTAGPLRRAVRSGQVGDPFHKSSHREVR